MRKIHLLFLTFTLFLIPLHGHVQEMPEFPPPLSGEQDLLTLEEIVPETAPLDEAMMQDQEPGAIKSTGSAEARKAAELDKLFWQLKREFKVEEAEKLSRQIHGLWSQSGSDTVDLLMQWAEDAIREEDLARAMDFLDNVVMLKPEFAEGWMRRASLHIQRHDLTLAMLDLNQTLRLEPRHYQAMSQLGLVMEMTQRKEAAMIAYHQALELYPQFVRLQKRLDNLLDEGTEQSL